MGSYPALQLFCIVISRKLHLDTNLVPILLE